jgi:hypothetical protein
VCWFLAKSGKTSLTGLGKRSDQFRVTQSFSPLAKPVWPVLETGLIGFTLAAGARVVFRCVFSSVAWWSLAPRSSSTPVDAWA